MKKLNQIRRENRRYRKNFLPTLFLTTLFWILLGGFIYLVDPDQFLAVPVFLIILLLTLLFTASLVLGNARRGLIVSLGTTVFLALRLFDIGNILNALIIVGLGLTIEIYFSRK